ncbi:MAG: hypothetical protein K2Y37_05945 [Pirellulales bacterium]|nr:hypothetical protein [Pirellulales bacterium]
MQPAPANTADRFAGGFRMLLVVLLLLGVPGIGQSISTRTRVAEEEEQNERDCSESFACATADGLRLRGRTVAADKRSARACWWLATGQVHTASVVDFPAGSLQLAAGALNGCGAFLRC